MRNIFFIVLLLSLFSCGNSEKKTVKSVKKKTIVKQYRPNITNQLSMKLVYIAPGSFDMGPIDEPYITKNILRTETHRVTLTKGFYIQNTETTVGQFRAFIKETKHKTQAENEKTQISYYINYNYLEPKSGSIGKKDRSWKNPGYKFDDNYPVTYVSWEDAQAFTIWLSKKFKQKYRLPTESEWEYACRAGTRTNFLNRNLKYTNISKDGNKPDPTLEKSDWYFHNSYGHPHPVGVKQPNQWGLYDIHGNLVEFCLDEFIYEYQKKDIVDPLYDNKESDEIVCRGGGWWLYSFLCTSSSRDFKKKDFCSNLYGFRVVKELSQNDIETIEK